MAQSNWNLEENCEAQRLKEDIAEEKWKEYNYAHEHAFLADLIKARREG